MAGTLEITEDLCWMPAGWVFDSVMERVAFFVGNTNPSLASRLLDARTTVNSGYLDLRNATKEELVTLLRGVELCLETSEQAGAESFYDPAFFTGFVQQVKSLRTMLQTALGSRG